MLASIFNVSLTICYTFDQKVDGKGIEISLPNVFLVVEIEVHQGYVGGENDLHCHHFYDANMGEYKQAELISTEERTSHGSGLIKHFINDPPLQVQVYVV